MQGRAQGPADHRHDHTWGLKKQGEVWAGGEILDPKNGKIYRAKMSLSEDGNSLNVRGFIGVSLIGRTQTWHRER